MTRRPDYADEFMPPRWLSQLACWCDTRLQISLIWQKLNELEEHMTTTEQAELDRGRTLIGLIRAEFASLHTQLDAAIADKDAAVSAGVASALGDDAAADAERLKGLIDELADALPGTVPDVPVPDPGQPAEVPAETPTEGDSGTGGDAGTATGEPATG